MKPIRLLAIIEATTITGPAKNLLGFAGNIRKSPEQPSVYVLIATFQRNGVPTQFAETVQQMSIPFFPIKEKHRFDFGVLSQLSARFQDLKPDLIQSHGVKSHFLVRLLGLHRMAPWIAFHHGYTWPNLRMRAYNQLDRWSLRAANHVITVNLPFQQELIRNGVRSSQIHVVHNSIDPQWAAAYRLPERAAALRKKLGIGRDQKVILFAGRLSNEKDPMTLLRAFHQLRITALSAPETPHLLMVGDGPNRKDLEAAALALGLTNAITWVGQVASTEPYFGIADIFVLSSLSEGSPNALLEAMAAQVPVVATSVGGIPEIVSDQESALLVKPQDPEGLARAMAALLKDTTLAARLAEQAYQKVLTAHAPDRHTHRLRQIYVDLINRPAG